MTDPELGPMKTCTRCREDWPDDGEFYHKGQKWCRACWLEWLHADPERMRKRAEARRAKYRREKAAA